MAHLRVDIHTQKVVGHCAPPDWCSSPPHIRPGHATPDAIRRRANNTILRRLCRVGSVETTSVESRTEVGIVNNLVSPRRPRTCPHPRCPSAQVPSRSGGQAAKRGHTPAGDREPYRAPAASGVWSEMELKRRFEFWVASLGPIFECAWGATARLRQIARARRARACRAAARRAKAAAPVRSAATPRQRTCFHSNKEVATTVRPAVRATRRTCERGYAEIQQFT